MQVIRETNGNVTFVLEDGDGELLEQFQRQARHNLDHEVLASMLDHFGFSGNAQYIPILPEDIGALTDAPMFSDEVEYLEDGSKNVTGSVWWFPAYSVEYFARVLRTQGQVTFSKAQQ